MPLEWEPGDLRKPGCIYRGAFARCHASDCPAHKDDPPIKMHPLTYALTKPKEQNNA